MYYTLNDGVGSIPSSLQITNDNIAINYSLDILFNCVGYERSLKECSSSTTPNECASVATVMCGLTGMGQVAYSTLYELIIYFLV